MPRLFLFFLLIVFYSCSPDHPDTLRKHHTQLDTCCTSTILSEHTVPVDTSYLKTLVGKTIGEVLDSLKLHHVHTEHGFPMLMGICCLSHYHIQLPMQYHMHIYVSDYKFIDPCEQSFEHWDEEEFMLETVAAISVQRRMGCSFRTDLNDAVATNQE